MGTVVTFDVRLADEARRADLAVALARAGALLRRLDAVFSLWRPESPASRLRRGELRLEDAPAEVAAVAAACERARLATAGWFDAELPGGFDPTGLVKGWAAARALEVLCRAGFGDCLVNAGGDIAAVAEVRGAIATSGTYERGAHLVNPRTGRHEARFASATVTGPDLGLADAAATALAVAGREGFAFVAALDGYEALAIGYDGTVLASPAFPLADPGDVAHGEAG
jgi:thiamine biosynthesis lipoprotein